MNEYTTVKIPKDVKKLVNKILDKKELGFQSTAEVVKASIRDLYDKYIGFEKKN